MQQLLDLGLKREFLRLRHDIKTPNSNKIKNKRSYHGQNHRLRAQLAPSVERETNAAKTKISHEKRCDPLATPTARMIRSAESIDRDAKPGSQFVRNCVEKQLARRSVFDEFLREIRQITGTPRRGHLP